MVTRSRRLRGRSSSDHQKKPTFFIGVQERDKHVVAYSVSSTPEELFELKNSQPKTAEIKTQPASPKISDVFAAFKSTMELYRKFIPFTLNLAPILSNVVGLDRIRDFAKKKGEERADLSEGDKKIYELSIECYREYTVYRNEEASAAEGVRHLPEVMVIGLISCYDAFLSSLLRAVLNARQEIVLTSDKAIKFSDLVKYSSIESARQAIIDREIEGIIRESHQEQFSWMEKRFNISLRKNLEVWPRFIEVCERRNLLTHTGGVVSEQYISSGRDQKFDISNITVGEKLTVDSDYFSDAVSIIYEIGIKLCFVLWKKFRKDETKSADTAVNELCYDLIYSRAYKLAEALLSYVSTDPSGEMAESTRLMLVTNYANAIRLQGRKEQAKSILENEDWSATSLIYQVSVAAVKEDVPLVTRLMEQIGPKGPPSAEDYRSWPVFRGMMTDEQFMSSFKKIFGEPVISASTSTVSRPLYSELDAQPLDTSSTKH